MAGVLQRGLAALVLSLALALGLVGCSQGATTRPDPAASRSVPGLQEVAPPAAVLQLKAALDSHHPRLTIQAPDDGSLLPSAPWDLEINVRDWPLVDAGPLGLGPHLVVQIDDQTPIRTTAVTPATAAAGDSRTVRLRLDPPSPGSHRITVYAARPWGEAVKDPAASAQITVHRVAATPHQTRSDAPQLLAVSPPTLSGSEPVLIDWLLRNAPLQHLRDGDTHWRLRITVNGDSFQVDRQMPLWLRGFQPGSNAVTLELLDGLGEPIAPGLNSVVQEVILQPGEQPVWNGKALAPEVLAALLGEGPPPAAAPQSTAATKTATNTAMVTSPPPPPAMDRAGVETDAVDAAAPATTVPDKEPTDTEAPGTQALPPALPPATTNETTTPALPATTATGALPPLASPPDSTVTAAANPVAVMPDAGEPETTAPETTNPDSAFPDAMGQPPAAASDTPTTVLPTDGDKRPAPADPAADHPKDQEAAAEPPLPQPPAPPRPSLPSARSELNADGSVIRPQPQGFLSGLRRALS